MSVMDFLFGRKTKSASLARDRLQIIIAQERVFKQAPDYLPTLECELLELLAKYVVNISENDIKINHEKKDGVSVLELNITLPEEELRNNKKSQTRTRATRSKKRI